MFRRSYIKHEDVRVPENGIAYFGPFWRFEIARRINSALADLMAYDGDLDSLLLSSKEAKAIGYINPRRSWMREERKLR